MEKTGSVWMRPERHSRGPDPAYSREQITVAAIRIADAEGLEAISMRRVAREVSAGAMSLYRYIGSKDELIELMVDMVQGEEPPPQAPSGDWRADLEQIAERQRDAMHRHPWLATVNVGRPTFGPNTLRGLEYALRCVDGLGLSIDRMLAIVLSVSSFARGFVQSELAEEEARRRTNLTEEQWRLTQAPYIRQILESGEFPLVAKVIRDAELPHMELDRQFRTGLAHLLDGISAQLDRGR
ncbi:MAG TPA: TetR/AcrR family transcriptional regulator [Actinophytocola sp.]|uniref:TetR/AcrR family transcriptional regulator n=1 Tax=Actinophytocola sp. TaxID=1872138 RepID=UPI002DFC0E30|nr:TetR/AcrR family transcriptional regulator [Actinophytocola sp.]